MPNVWGVTGHPLFSLKGWHKPQGIALGPFQPERLAQASPGHRPGAAKATRDQALKGRNNRRGEPLWRP